MNPFHPSSLICHPSEHPSGYIFGLIITTGVASVANQLVMIREFLSLFGGNEFIISMVLFNWLLLGGLGTLAERWYEKPCFKLPPPLPWVIARFCLVLCALGPAQVIGARMLNHFWFLEGTSRGFYAIFGFTFLVSAPYCLLVGFLLPFSLSGAKRAAPKVSSTEIYMADNAGDTLGGVLFSFLFIFFLSPVQAAAAAGLPLFVLSVKGMPAGSKGRMALWILPVSLAVLFSLGLERPSLGFHNGSLAVYRETPYGRVEVRDQAGRSVFILNSIPLFDSQDTATAEKRAHFPLAQLERVGKVLLVSASPGCIREIQKYHPDRIDYLEIDPEVSGAMVDCGFIDRPPNLNVIHQDARAYLSRTRTRYDAVILNLPGPDTFQANRLYTAEFFAMVRSRLTDQGTACFFVQGYDNYPSPGLLKQLSCLYAAASLAFDHVLVLPGGETYFILGNNRLTSDIPNRLKAKHIRTSYLEDHFYGDFSPMRLQTLMAAIDPSAPANTDFSPGLLPASFEHWFETFGLSPTLFFGVTALVFLGYLCLITPTETLLFTTGLTAMGVQLMILFAFQILFGCLYLKTGVLLTLFLAGLLPGAWAGRRFLKGSARGRALMADMAILIWIAVFTGLLYYGHYTGRPPGAWFFYGASFLTAFLMGLEFAFCVPEKGDTASMAAGLFAADLMGGAAGIIVFSLVLLPFCGMFNAGLVLVLIKALGLARCLIWNR